MTRLLEDQHPAEHLLREWLRESRAEVLDDLDQLEERGLEVVYADLHAEGATVAFLALPLDRTKGKALAWYTVSRSGHHVRYVALTSLVGVALDEDTRLTRLTLQFNPPTGSIEILAIKEAQRLQAREVADSLQLRLLNG